MLRIQSGQCSKMALLYFSLIGLFFMGIPSQIFSETGNDSTASLFPDWFRNNMDWYLEGMISEQELANGFEHLININVIFLSPERAQEVQDLRDENKRLQVQLDDLDKSFQQLKSEPTVEELLQLFLKLNIHDPNNSPEIHDLMANIISLLKEQDIPSAQQTANIAKEMAEKAASEVPSSRDIETEKDVPQGTQPGASTPHEQPSDPSIQTQPTTQTESAPHRETCTNAVFDQDLPISFSKGDRVMFKANFAKQFDSISEVTLKSYFSAKDPFEEGDAYFVDNLGGKKALDFDSTIYSEINLHESVNDEFLDGEYTGWYVNEAGSFTLDGGMEICVQEPNECKCKNLEVYPKDEKSGTAGVKVWTWPDQRAEEWSFSFSIPFEKALTCEKVDPFADKCVGSVQVVWAIQSVEINGKQISVDRANNFLKTNQDNWWDCENKCTGDMGFTQKEIRFFSSENMFDMQSENWNDDKIKISVQLAMIPHCGTIDEVTGEFPHEMQLKFFKEKDNLSIKLDKSNSDYDYDGHSNINEARNGTDAYRADSIPKP